MHNTQYFYVETQVPGGKPRKPFMVKFDPTTTGITNLTQLLQLQLEGYKKPQDSLYANDEVMQQLNSQNCEPQHHPATLKNNEIEVTEPVNLSK